MATNNMVKATKDGQEATFVRSAFEKVWKDKGWKLVEDAEPVRQNTLAAESDQTPARPVQARDTKKTEDR